MVLMEFCPGRDLFQAVSSPGFLLTISLVRRVTRQLLQALAFLHTADIVHLDIKHTNILFHRGADIRQVGETISHNISQYCIADSSTSVSRVL